ncbi:MAG TPA: toll/interleukin-1 receptor domain-containing protein [Anaerolineales bacterium]|nr:toll/interleukin-1 receptor domain-containing protein [Anaerolineales bacterium]
MAETKFKYDVFISYSGKDRSWIKKNLLPKLKQKGLKTCVDYRDFPAGKSSMVNMSDAVNKSRHTLLVMTPNWVKTEWTFFEALLARRKDPTGIRQRTIPLLVKKCKVADILSILTWVDFTERGSKATAWNQLYTALGKRPSPKHKRQVHKKKNANWYLAHPYAMSPNFTGRVAECNMLSQWLNEDKQHPLLVLRALGGFGKSALSWYWLLHDVDSAKWQKVVWWSFYEGDASFENFISKTLDYLKIEKPEGQRNQVDKLLDLMKKEDLLLVMDGFERALRAYSGMNAAYQGDETAKDEGAERDCVNINAEIFLKNLSSLPETKSKVLMTTRLTPRAVEKHGHWLEGCLEKELMAMDKDDAVKFFRSEGIRGTHVEIEEACGPYGFHPLSLRLLAGLIVSDLQTPGDIAVAKRLDISNDIVQNKHHVLEQAYNTMPKERQKLLSQIACFRSPVPYDALKSIATVEVDSKTTKKSKSKKSRSSKSKVSKSKQIILYPDFDNDLRDLLIRGLLHHDTKTNKYDLHPIVRRYAYDRLTAPQRTDAHVVLVVYFEAVPKPEKVEKLEDLAPVIELYHHMLRAGNLDEAQELYGDRLANPIYFQFGAYQLEVELLRALFLDSEDKPPRLKDESAQAWTLNSLATSYALSGQPRRAVPLFLMGNELDEKSGNKKGVAIGLGNVAYMAQIYIGALREAEHNLRQSIDLFHEIQHEFGEAVGHQELGRVLSYRGAWQEAEQELDTGLKLFEKQHNVQSEGIIWSYRALRFLLMEREAVGSNQLYPMGTMSVDSNQSLIVNLKSSIEFAQRTLELADEWSRTQYPMPRDYVRAHWLLGAAYCASVVSIHPVNNVRDYLTTELESLTLAEENLSKALNLCRQINSVDAEADILLDLARLRYAQGDFKDAQEKASEALVITERSGYVLQGADVNLFLAELAVKGYKLESEKGMSNKEAALLHAKRAKELATCDGPPYYYKVAYEEAERMLKDLA